MTYIIGTAIKKLGGFRISTEAEITGIDESEHAETAYSFSSVLGGGLTGSAAATNDAQPAAASKERVDV